MKGLFPSIRMAVLAFCLALAWAAMPTPIGSAKAIEKKDNWLDLQTKGTVFHRLKIGDGFLGSKDEGWDQVARLPAYARKKCVFLPAGAMAYQKPALKDRSGEAVANWFARVYRQEKVYERGTSVKAGSQVCVFSRAPVEVFPNNSVKIKSSRQRGNFIQIELVETGNQGYSSRPGGSLYWPLLELPLKNLPRGVYAIEVVWHFKNENNDNKGTFRQITAVSVSDGEGKLKK
jgi:hypothetical protein